MKSVVCAATLGILLCAAKAPVSADWVSSGWTYDQEEATVTPGSGGAAGYTYQDGDPYVYAYVSQEDAEALGGARYTQTFTWQGAQGQGAWAFYTYGRVVGKIGLIEDWEGASFASQVGDIVADAGPDEDVEGYSTSGHDNGNLQLYPTQGRQVVIQQILCASVVWYGHADAKMWVVISAPGGGPGD